MSQSLSEPHGSEDEDEGSGSEARSGIYEFSDSEHIDDRTSRKLQSAYDDPGNQELDANQDSGTKPRGDSEIDGGSDAD
ncbi:hypothetical protein LTR91_001076 [Friedmanniomyces endolithicus]|uniref:Uncharacterized protein n=1 Tax=Friedmanniomyces endolithicus TaxID=329885 RepID=A0AAN6J976_9PEZI|nr:hypothetical protein LTS09_011746 [Friedmanniomyces endolithicus]KAK0268803.1 hypothetical protein LTR35_015225 [Friedmanniomyces endolithicus]KAK0300004.1 hypothetical protein LTS00_001774 [Friedmanniomyces endolithicus]KAK0307547.1 hypothetical protein LTR01_005547 [Friedmanniomyces endolithicus]KAK0321157.1 hypothetical protein LTR82_007609 [Friedmanniomyces endolithicus]